LNLCNNTQNSRKLPWRLSAATGRKDKEEVRPIFWSNRPSSYMSRTSSWDDFPNGRWGDSRSPAYGEPSDYHLASNHGLTKKQKRELWGATPTSEQDIYDIFEKYCKGEITSLPWNDVGLSPESEVIALPLNKINKNGFLTINSQPRVNAAESTDPKFGWGGIGGYVYQKSYVEFFTSPENLKCLIHQIGVEASVHNLSYVYANIQGETGTNLKGPCAVTWGVFPGREIIQPTVVDPDAFRVWKDEAFALWKTQWAKIYEPGSVAHTTIMNMHDSYFLVAIVDNNFISGNIFSLFENVLSKKEGNK